MSHSCIARRGFVEPGEAPVMSLGHLPKVRVDWRPLPLCVPGAGLLALFAGAAASPQASWCLPAAEAPEQMAGLQRGTEASVPCKSSMSPLIPTAARAAPPPPPSLPLPLLHPGLFSDRLAPWLLPETNSSVPLQTLNLSSWQDLFTRGCEV